MSLDPNKTYLEWNGTNFPNSTNAQFKAPAGSTIDWGDGTIETFDTASTTVNTHTYTDGKTAHTIAISGLTNIPSFAFCNCHNLINVTIGNNVTSIGESAFNGCTSLTSVTIPDSVTSIGDFAFYGCNNLKSVTIGNGVTIIGDYAFSGCSSLTSAIIGNSVTSIGDYAFNGCSSLTSAIIGNSVTSIGDGVFADCSSLTSITIPDSVTSIGSWAFYGCNSLKIIVLFPSKPPTLGSNDAIPTATTIYVQQSSKEAYKKATNWTAFVDKIESNNTYLSLIRFNKKNKEYIDGKIFETNEAIKAENAKLKAQLDYLAMMTNVELDGEDEGNEEV